MKDMGKHIDRQLATIQIYINAHEHRARDVADHLARLGIEAFLRRRRLLNDCNTKRVSFFSLRTRDTEHAAAKFEGGVLVHPQNAFLCFELFH